MMKETVANAVSELRFEAEKRNEQIRSTINALEREAAGGKVLIDQFMNDLVAFEMAGDEKGQSETEKKLVLLRTRQADIQDHLKAYRGTLANTSFIRPGLKKVFEVADAAQQERIQENARENAATQILEQQLLDLREKLLQLHGSARFSSHEQQRDLREIASLLALIEQRPVENPIAYLQSLAQGATTEMLEQYLSRPAPALTPQQQQRDGVVVKLPPQSGRMGEARSLCRGEHTSSGFIAQQ